MTVSLDTSLYPVQKKTFGDPNLSSQVGEIGIRSEIEAFLRRSNFAVRLVFVLFLSSPARLQKFPLPDVKALLQRLTDDPDERKISTSRGQNIICFLSTDSSNDCHIL